VEIPAVCKDDLVIIPKKLATALGGVSTTLLCHKVASAIHLVDPKTLKLVHLNSIQYFHYEKDIQVVNIKEAGTLFQVV
jgi:nonsense-mediated mRNA decay protein 3